MSTIQQELIIKARADVANAKQGLASLDKSVDGLASAQEGLQTASEEAAKGLGAEAAAAADSARATAAAAKAAEEAADAARQLGSDAKGAGSGMDKAAGEARKLTDQIKEVGDGLDVAAGKMVEGIGGPTAIKAIAGAGIALGALKEIAGAFLESSEALFKSWGEDGMKVWDITERGLFKLKGSFASAVLGADDMYLAAGRLTAGFEALQTGVQLVIELFKQWLELSPAGQTLQYLFDVTGATEGYADMIESATAKIKRQVEAEKNAAASAGALAKPLGTAREQYEQISETVDRLTGKVVDKDKVERDSTIQRLKDLQTLAIAEENNAHMKAIRDNAELKRAEYTANATRSLMDRAQSETAKAISEMDDDDRTLLSDRQRREMLQSRLAELIATERPRMVEAQMAAYRSEATALMREMGSPLEAGTQLLIDQLQYQINDIENAGVKAAETAGNKIGSGLAKGIAEGSKKDSNWADNLGKYIQGVWDKAQERAIRENAGWAALKAGELYQFEIEMGYREASDPYEAIKKDQERFNRENPEPPAKPAAAVAQAQKAASASLAETSSAVLDLAGAFETLSGAQEGAVDKMRQVVDVVIKIMQATEALSAVQATQAATATASAAATATAATSAATATAGAGAAAGSAFVPVLTAVTAAVGLLGSLFSSSPAPTRNRGGGNRTVYTSAGESQGAGGDFAYFEGGRSNVTIVTNDAASIRAMQGRLAFVGSRGGSGF